MLSRVQGCVVKAGKRIGDRMAATLSVREGDRIPSDIVFKTRANSKWVDLPIEDVFKGKVVLFGLPGAFTPTCSSTHLPRYAELSSEFTKAGVDRIVCVTVNDAFVCNAWLKDLKVNPETIQILPDGNAEFTEKIGAAVDKSAIGFGKRSWRYSMLVDNGKIVKVFSEPDVEGDPFQVSDADTMLKYIKEKK